MGRKDRISMDTHQKVRAGNGHTRFRNGSLYTSSHRDFVILFQPAIWNMSEIRAVYNPQQSGVGSTIYLEKSSFFLVTS